MSSQESFFHDVPDAASPEGKDELVRSGQETEDAFPGIVDEYYNQTSQIETDEIADMIEHLFNGTHTEGYKRFNSIIEFLTDQKELAEKKTGRAFRTSVQPEVAGGHIIPGNLPEIYFVRSSDRAVLKLSFAARKILEIARPRARSKTCHTPNSNS